MLTEGKNFLETLELKEEDLQRIAQEEGKIVKEMDNGLLFEVKVVPIIFKEERNLAIIIKDLTDFKRMEIQKMDKEYQNLIIETISHELRTPLNGIRGNLEMIDEKTDSQELKLCAENGLRSSEMLFYLIKNANTLALLESNSLEIQKDGFVLNEVISGVCDLIQTELKQRDVSLIIRVGENVPDFVYSDKSCLEQILVILLSNAAKYTFVGSVVIEITFQKENSLLCIKIIDTGIGIPQQNLARIFEAFSALKNNKAHKHGLFIKCYLNQCSL
jgi:signal transduction histidine kinase